MWNTNGCRVIPSTIFEGVNFESIFQMRMDRLKVEVLKILKL